jgi:hypothetical protein
MIREGFPMVCWAQGKGDGMFFLHRATLIASGADSVNESGGAGGFITFPHIK